MSSFFVQKTWSSLVSTAPIVQFYFYRRGVEVFLVFQSDVPFRLLFRSRTVSGWSVVSNWWKVKTRIRHLVWRSRVPQEMRVTVVKIKIILRKEQRQITSTDCNTFFGIPSGVILYTIWIAERRRVQIQSISSGSRVFITKIIILIGWIQGRIASNNISSLW